MKQKPKPAMRQGSSLKLAVSPAVAPSAKDKVEGRRRDGQNGTEHPRVPDRMNPDGPGLFRYQFDNPDHPMHKEKRHPIDILVDTLAGSFFQLRNPFELCNGNCMADSGDEAVGYLEELFQSRDQRNVMNDFTDHVYELRDKHPEEKEFIERMLSEAFEMYDSGREFPLVVGLCTGLLLAGIPPELAKGMAKNWRLGAQTVREG